MADEFDLTTPGASPAGDDPSASGQPAGKRNPSDANESDAEAAMLAMLEGQQVGDNDQLDAQLANLPNAERVSPGDIQYQNTVARPADFQQLSGRASEGPARPIDMILDINLPISIELGRTKMNIADILALGPGSVVELNKLAGEPVEVLVNQRTVALGEVVVVDENFGVRITQLVSPEDRIKALKERVD